MKMLVLKCDSCGAPLDMPAGSSDVSCLYCENRVLIERTSATSPPPKSATPAKEPAKSSQQEAIDQLDREWEAYRAKYLERDEDGQYDIPVEEHCRIGIWATVVIALAVILAGILWEPVPAVVPFSMLILLAAGFTVFRLRQQMHVARVYAKSKRNYEQERLALVKSASGTSNSR